MLNLRYQGQWYDAETGTSDNGYRTFESYLGRYAQTDPTGLNAGVSTFAYVGNNPLIGVDPMGLQVIPVPEYRPVPIPIPDMPAPRHSYPNLDPAALCLAAGPACVIPAAQSAMGAEDIWPFSKTKPTSGTCPKDDGGGDDDCYKRADKEAGQCSRWIGRGPTDDPNRWYRACLDRAAYRRTLCLKGVEDGPPAWSDNDLK